MKSWYGDSIILLNIRSIFELRATLNKTSSESKQTKHQKSRFSKFVKIFKLSADKLHHLASEFPDFKRFLILRATRRRAHFIHVLE